jgi:anti-sigma regulatory factor (Ser/Thr protein kinase)
VAHAFYAAGVRTEQADGESHDDLPGLTPAAGERPVVELVDPTPAQARHAVIDALPSGRLSAEQASGLELAVSEVVTNAIVHGYPPVVLHAWLPGPGGVVVTVHDAGTEPARPLGDSLPGPGADGGRGRWICRRSVDRIDDRCDADGYVVRLVAGFE